MAIGHPDRVLDVILYPSVDHETWGRLRNWRLERRDSVVQGDRPPHRFAVCRKEPAEPRTLEMPKPATRAGREHPAGAGGTADVNNRSLPQLPPIWQPLSGAEQTRARA
jgi:hypothetical protein